MKMNIKNSTKQVFKHSTLVVLAAAMSLSSCKDKDKEVAPKTETSSIDKAFENGFVKGTVKGMRKDGTAFEETFEYKVTTDQSYFEKLSGTEHTLRLWRSKGIAQDDNNINLNLVVTNKDQAGATAKITGGYFEFSKPLADRNLFHLDAGTNFAAQTIVLPVSRANNATYKLVDNGWNLSYHYDSELRQSMYYVADTDGNKIYFGYSEVYDATTGQYYYPFRYVVSSTGVKSTSSPVWSSVRMIDNERGTRIFATATGTDLSETLQVPGDTQEITNFAYNASTGVVTFDYKLNISEFRGYDRSYNNVDPANTSMHALEIKGSVSATVYNGAVMRKSAL
jgi:hypothetical protein